MTHTCIKDDGGTPNRKCEECEAEREQPRQAVMTLMFDARIDAMASELSKVDPGDLDTPTLRRLHEQTTRLLAGIGNYEQTYGLPQETHEG